jgi:uncharacterized surface protein with fasciclin (FAS1) repeats
MLKRTALQWARLPFGVAAIVLVAACASVPATTNVTDTAARTPQLSTLSRLINEAGLADTLRGAGPFTVFAPSDEAFKAVPADTLAKLAADKEMLRAVLTYHVLPGKLGAGEVQNGNAKTVQGANVALSKAGTFVTVDDAVVQTADVAVTNGVVHIIDRVLMPPKK